MFSQKPEPSPSELQDVMFPLKTTLQETTVDKSKDDADWFGDAEEKKPEVVTIVEKLSGILSPYFIVVVGLFLHDDNVLIGTILVLVGIASLLKISFKDITTAFESIKNLINSKISQS